MEMYELTSLILVAIVSIVLIVILLVSNKNNNKELKVDYIAISPSYHKGTDMMYISLDGDPLNTSHEIENTPLGYIVHYNEIYEPRGIEIMNFSTKGNSFPMILEIDAKKPFTIKILGVEE